MIKNKSMKKGFDNGSSSFGAATYAGEATKNYSNATEAAFEGMDAVKNIADRLINVGTGQSQGNIFEYIEVTKFNMDSAIQSSDLKAVVTADIGRPHDPTDIEILLGNTVVRKVQAKSSRSAVESLFAQSDAKYEGMQRLSPSEQFDRMSELAQMRIDKGTLKADDYQDTLDNLSKGLSHDNVSSDGTTRDEAVRAVTNPDEYTRNFKIDTVSAETVKVITNAAVAGGAICGAISITKNIMSVKSGELKITQASINVVKDVSIGSISSASTAAISTLIKDISIDQGLSTLAKSNVATAVAVSSINVAKSIIKYAKGDITLQDMTIEIGQNGASSVAGLYYGLIGGVVAGPVGALVGSIVGYTVANISYQTVIEIFKTSNHTVAEYERLRSIYEDAIYQLEKSRVEFESYMQKYFKYSNQMLDDSFSMMDTAIGTGDVDTMSLGLVNIASIFGKELDIKTFKGFYIFMENPDSVLEL